MAQTTRRVLATDERARRPHALLDNISKPSERILSAGEGLQWMNVSEPSR